MTGSPGSSGPLDLLLLAHDDGDGPAVVLLHGQPGTADDFAEVLPALTAQGCRVLAVDRPGYTGDPAAVRSITDNAVAVVALLDRLGLRRAVLVGHSYGGAVALATALDHPGRVEGLVLVSSVGAPRSVTALDRWLARPWAGRVAAATFPKLSGMLELTSGSRLTPADRRRLRHGRQAWLDRRVWAAFRREQEYLVREVPALWERLPALRCPVTVIHGTRDGYVPVAAARALAARIPHARSLEVDAGHVLTLETPRLIAVEAARLTDADRVLGGPGPAGAGLSSAAGGDALALATPSPSSRPRDVAAATAALLRSRRAPRSTGGARPDPAGRPPAGPAAP